MMSKNICILQAVILTALLFAGCHRQQATIKSLSDLKKGVRLGAMTGTTGEALALKRFSETSIQRFDDVMDAVAALKAGQVDAVITANPQSINVCKHNHELYILDEPVDYEDAAIALRKDDTKLAEDMNVIIRKLKQEGTLADLSRRWLKKDLSPYDTVHIPLPSSGKLLKIGTSATREPFIFVDAKGEITGHDGEFSKRIAAGLNRPLQIIDMKFPALIPALISGKIDAIVTGMTATEERKKSVLFTDVYFTTTQVIIAKKPLSAITGAQTNENFITSVWHGVSKSFYNNIILENRYLIILDGLKATIEISFFSTIIGTLLGALVCFMRMSKRKLPVMLAKLFILVLRGTPVLVILMIVYYVIFASVNIDAVLVSVFAFGMNFAAYVSEMFRTGIEGVDRGQTEAGIAIGFSKIKTFYYIIIPQAVKRILPVYKGELISMVKMTSVVGYIAVQDLTKASDIIRSRTFDAFFPLIMVAVIYLILSWLLMMLIGYIEKLSDQKHSVTGRA